MRTRRKGRWLLKQPRLGARMCQGTFFFTERWNCMEHTDKKNCCSGMAEHAEAAKPDAAEKKAEHKEGKPCCCHKKKERSEKEYKDLIHRLNRIEGQIRGIRNMVEQDAYCPDILIQVAAANAALNSFNKVLLGNHLRTCVANDIREGHDETIDELLKVLQRLMK